MYMAGREIRITEADLSPAERFYFDVANRGDLTFSGILIQLPEENNPPRCRGNPSDHTTGAVKD